MKSELIGNIGPSYKVLPSDKDRSNRSDPKSERKPEKKKTDKADQNVVKKNDKKALIDEYV
ncbi:MAG: hypothetical protein KUG72_03010 [Pseudomonadales bacterium]|nr:hypothetical protein [Pseudomonadales bacterium]